MNPVADRSHLAPLLAGPISPAIVNGFLESHMAVDHDLLPRGSWLFMA
jgi:hypothetical protein